MKRPLLAIAVAAVALAACTKNDVVISDADPMIEFDAPFVGKSVIKSTDDTKINDVILKKGRIIKPEDIGYISSIGMPISNNDILISSESML